MRRKVHSILQSVKEYVDRSPKMFIFSGSLLWLSVVVPFIYTFGNMPSTIPVLPGDPGEYVVLGNAILNHEVYSLSEGNEKFFDSFRTPGYPVFIALVSDLFGSLDYVIVVQLLLYAASAVLIFSLGEILFDRKVAWLTTILWMINPSGIFHASFIWTDFFFTFVLLLSISTALWAYASKGYTHILTIASGLLLGYAILVRPVAQFLPVMVFLILALLLLSKVTRCFVGKKGLLLIFLWFVSCVVVVSPWSVRNYVRFDTFEISSVSAFNLLYYNLTEHNAYEKGLPTPEQLIPESVPSYDKSLFRSFVYQELYTNIAKRYLQEHWFSYLKFHLVKTTAFFIAPSYTDLGLLFFPDIEKTYRSVSLSSIALHFDVKSLFSLVYSQVKVGDYSFVLYLANAVFWVYLFMFSTVTLVVSLLKKPRTMETFVILSFALLVLYFAVLTGPVAIARYRLPVEPYVLLTAVAGCTYLCRYLKSGRLSMKKNGYVGM